MGERVLSDKALFAEFATLLREYGVLVSVKDLLELRAGLDKGLVADLESLFVLMRLVFVRRVEHMDAFERAFALYFYGIDIPPVREGDLELFNTRQFRAWLEEQIRTGQMARRAYWEYDPEALMRRFWETLRAQMEAHHGGSRWIGTQGNSAFGHSGNAARGVRVLGESQNRSALKVIGERRYVEYAESNQLRAENLRQALEAMKHMKNEGPRDRLNLDETIRRTARNGGDIELVFERDLRDKINVILLIDNGGQSMRPFIEATRLLFSKMHERFEDISTFYFHNTIYQEIWTDFRRFQRYSTERLLQRREDARLVIMGDASMAPEELEYRGGAISNYMNLDSPPSLYWLKRLSDRFRHACWLNPIPEEQWAGCYGSYSIERIRGFFPMEDMTLRGIKGMAARLSEK